MDARVIKHDESLERYTDERGSSASALGHVSTYSPSVMTGSGTTPGAPPDPSVTASVTAGLTSTSRNAFLPPTKRPLDEPTGLTQELASLFADQELAARDHVTAVLDRSLHRHLLIGANETSELRYALLSSACDVSRCLRLQVEDGG